MQNVMKTTRVSVAALGCAYATVDEARAVTFNTLDGLTPIVIAYRGASGYLPEHTLAAYELAMEMAPTTSSPTCRSARTARLSPSTTPPDPHHKRRNAVRRRATAATRSPISPSRRSRRSRRCPGATASYEYPGFTPSSPDPFRVPIAFLGVALASLAGLTRIRGRRAA